MRRLSEMLQGPATSAEHLARSAFAAAASVFAVCVVVQVFLVGVDVFSEAGGGSVHRDFAYAYGWLTPVMVVLAGLGHVGTRGRLLTGALLVLFAVQTALPTLAEMAPMVAAIHAVNALAIFWLAVAVTRLAVAAARQSRPEGG